MTLLGMSFLKNLDLQYSGDRLEIKKHVEKSNTDVVPAPTKTTTSSMPSVPSVP